jgi:hypothetical protein
MADTLLSAETSSGVLYACVSAGTRTDDPIATPERLTAFLRPFTGETEARAVLEAAGGTNIQKKEVRR